MEERGAEGFTERLVSGRNVSDRGDDKEMQITNAARIHGGKNSMVGFLGSLASRF
jgi:hypothetical protein